MAPSASCRLCVTVGTALISLKHSGDWLCLRISGLIRALLKIDDGGVLMERLLLSIELLAANSLDSEAR